MKFSRLFFLLLLVFSVKNTNFYAVDSLTKANSLKDMTMLSSLVDSAGRFAKAVETTEAKTIMKTLTRKVKDFDFSQVSKDQLRKILSTLITYFKSNNEVIVISGAKFADILVKEMMNYVDKFKDSKAVLNFAKKLNSKAKEFLGSNPIVQSNLIDSTDGLIDVLD